MKNNTLYELTRFEEMSKAIPIPGLSPFVSCPHCEALQVADDTKHNIKCTACGMLYKI